MDHPRVDPALIADLHRLHFPHCGRLVAFVAIYVAAAGGSCWIAAQCAGNWLIGIACLPLYLLAAASLHGVSLFTHEGVHGLLSPNRCRNHVFSALCAMPVLQNFAAYRVLHLRHHQHLGLPGDPDHYENYVRWTWLVFAMHWGRLILGYPAYLVAIPLLGFRHGNRVDRIWIAVEIAALAALAIGVVSFVPWPVLLHGWLIPMMIVNTLVNVRGMSQHTLLEHHADPILGTRSILTNPVTTFFTCNENYHLEHHLYPGVPWYNLARLHGALKDQLVACGAPFIPSYFAFVREFVVGSWRRSPLGRFEPRDG